MSLPCKVAQYQLRVQNVNWGGGRKTSGTKNCPYVLQKVWYVVQCSDSLSGKEVPKNSTMGAHLIQSFEQKMCVFEGRRMGG